MLIGHVPGSVTVSCMDCRQEMKIWVDRPLLEIQKEHRCLQCWNKISVEIINNILRSKNFDIKL